jgi:transposase-like protein
MICPIETRKKMSRRCQRSPSPALKAKVTLEDVEGEANLAELAKRFDVQPNPVTR